MKMTMGEINERTIERLKKDVIGLHKFNPQYVILDESSAVPIGFMLKEAWRQAYPDEKPPMFYRINPRRLQQLKGQARRVDYLEFQKKIENEEGLKFDPENKKFDEEKKRISNYFKQRIKNPNSRIFIYDEETVTGDSPGIVADMLTNPETYGLDKDIKSKEVRMTQPGYTKGKFKHYAYPDVEGVGVISRNYRVTEKPTCDSRELAYPVRSDPGASANIAYLKQIGKEAGQEILRASKNKKVLEQKVCEVAAMLTFALSLFFIDSNLTGNAITNTTIKSSNFIGAGLIIISLISGFFAWRGRK